MRIRYSSNKYSFRLSLLLVVLAVSVCLTSGETAHAVVQTNVAVADAFISSGDWANTNDDGSALLGFGLRAVGQQNAFTGNQIGRQLYRFQVPAVVAAGDVLAATLRLKVYDNFAGFPHDTAVCGLADGWNESTVTWNTQPATNSGELDNVSAYCCGNSYGYDVTGYVINQLTALDHTISFQQRGQDENIIGGVRWFLKEGHGINYGGIVGEAPQLILTLVPEPASAVLLDIGSMMLVHRQHV
jgi:hypothetical protein